MTSFLPIAFNSTSLPESSPSALMRQLLLLLLFEDNLECGARSIGVRWWVLDEEPYVRLVPAKKPPLRRYALIEGKDTTMMATAISAIESMTARMLVSTLGAWITVHLQTFVHACITSIVA